MNLVDPSSGSAPPGSDAMSEHTASRSHVCCLWQGSLGCSTMPTCCAVACSSSIAKGDKLFVVPRGKNNEERTAVWLHRIGRKNFDCHQGRLCEVGQMDPKELHATLMIDEIQLTPGLAYDASSGTIFGAPTVPLANGTLPDGCLATHAIVFMLGGVSTRWKQVVAYHLTGNSFHAKTMKQIIMNVITVCEKVGIRLHVVVIMDMARGNQSLWKLFGIVVGKHSKPKVS
ncbi:hypothetical protein HPB51_021108 [Rhipicephalus microplus]|uniref:Transposable element P transposase-like RNase H domain-containing protein n=1 Tax=Rhipicephalus microplus TaxID=6941 RepID=A0A9J6E4K3_RHIMP|nr:hypothetical protein HPB51_021108 [Rhipicephalus microplus]